MIKLLEVNIGVNLLDFTFFKWFLRYNIKKQNLEKIFKIDKLSFLKILKPFMLQMWKADPPKEEKYL